MGVILTTYEPGVPSSKGCWIDTLTGVAPDAIMARLKGWKPGSPTSYGNPHWLPGIGATPNPKVTGPHNYQLYTNNCCRADFLQFSGYQKSPPQRANSTPPPQKKITPHVAPSAPDGIDTIGPGRLEHGEAEFGSQIFLPSTWAPRIPQRNIWPRKNERLPLTKTCPIFNCLLHVASKRRGPLNMITGWQQILWEKNWGKHRGFKHNLDLSDFAKDSLQTAGFWEVVVDSNIRFDMFKCLVG